MKFFLFLLFILPLSTLAQDSCKLIKEADPFTNKISNESPIAKAIMGHKVGNKVLVESPNGKYEVEILEISK